MDHSSVESMVLEKSKDGSRIRTALKKRMPILIWARRYTRLDALGDIVAGLTLGLMLVPQAIAYASLAGLPVHIGLYSSFIGGFVYMFFGTVKEVSMGPTSLMALLTLQSLKTLPAETVALLSLLSGAVVLLMGVLKLGFLVDLISPTVTSGFTSATAVIIVSAQLKGLLGLSFSAESLPENLSLLAQHIHDVKIPDLALGSSCCLILLLLRKLKDVRVENVGIQRALWLVSIARNALVVCVASVLAYYTHDGSNPLFRLSGRVQGGVPPLKLPPFSVQIVNEGQNETLNFGGLVQEFGASVFILPLVMVLANIAIAKAFMVGKTVDATQEMLTLGLCNVLGSFCGAMPVCEAYSPISIFLFMKTSLVGKAVDATQEMLTLGMCNVLGSFCGAMPVCGAFTRSAVSHSSGVRSPVAGVYSGLIVLFALGLLTPYFYYIPKACLSAVLICAVIFMIDISTVRRLYKENRPDLAVYTATFVVSILVSVEFGVLCGAMGDLGRLVKRVAGNGRVVEGRSICAIPPAALVYVNAGRLASRLVALSRSKPNSIASINLSEVRLLDHAGVEELERLVTRFEKAGQKLILFGASGKPAKILEKTKWAGPYIRVPNETKALALAEETMQPLLIEDAPIEKAINSETSEIVEEKV